MQTFSKFLIKILGITTFLISLNSCGTFSNPGAARKMEMEGRERAKKNVEEGRGFSINKIGHALHDLDTVFEKFSRTK